MTVPMGEKNKTVKRKSIGDTMLIGSIDDVAQMAMGDFGVWQARICFFLSLLKFSASWIQMSIVFLAAPLSFHCENSQHHCQTKTGEQCHKWVYSQEVFKETIVSEWDLVCELDEAVNFGQSFTILGLFIGSVLIGGLSDSVGRKKPLIIAAFLQLINGTLAAMAPTYSLFIFFRFLQAVSVGGDIAVGYVLMMELLGGKWKAIMTSLTYIPFAIGQVLMVVFAYFARDWRIFQLCITLPGIFPLFYIWLVPESPRWLLAMGKTDEAFRILEKAARTNNNPIIEEIRLELTKGKGKQTLHVQSNCCMKFVGFLDTPYRIVKTIILCSAWFVAGIGVFGLEEYISSLGGDIFVNLTIAGLTIIPGILFSMYMNEKFGRKKGIIFSLFLISISCLSLAAVKESPGISISTIWIVALGEFALGVLFPTLYLYTAEFYPTLIRSIGVGVCGAACKLGFMVAPFISDMGQKNIFLPPLVYGSCAAVSCVFCFCIPETQKMVHHQAVDDEKEIFDREKAKALVTEEQEHSVNTGILNKNYGFDKNYKSTT